MPPNSTRTTRHKHPQRADAPESEQQQQQQPELERVEEGQEISPEAAQRLQPQLGNQALAGLLSGTESESLLETEEEAEEEAAPLELIEDAHEDVELEGPQHGGGGGGGGGSDDGGGDGEGGDPWDLGYLFDDDDDDPEAPRRRARRLRASPIRGEAQADETFYDDDDTLTREDLEPAEVAIGPAPSPGLRQGDAIYAAVESALTNPATIGRRTLEPESLVDIAGALDPIGRPLALTRFLATHASAPRARSAARVLPWALGVSTGGHAAMVARLAALTVCAEAHEGGAERTDRAVMLSASQQSWSLALRASRQIYEESGQLDTVQIVERVTEAALHEDTSIPPRPSPLGGDALRSIIPPPYIPDIPQVDLHAPRRLDPADPMDQLDAALTRFTGGQDPFQTPEDPPLERTRVAPLLDAAQALVEASGRAQVELAAAALAVHRIRPQAPTTAPLKQASANLTRLARQAHKAGRAVQALIGQPTSGCQPRIERSARTLTQVATRLRALRASSFSTLAGAMDA